MRNVTYADTILERCKLDLREYEALSDKVPSLLVADASPIIVSPLLSML